MNIQNADQSPQNSPYIPATLKPSVEPSLLAGVNVLLEGGGGTGKTHAIGTLVDAGVEVFYQSLESGMESLIGYWTDLGRPVPPNLRWNILDMVQKGTAGSSGFEHLITKADQIGSQTQDSLYKLQDMTRGQRNHFKNLLGNFANFHDQRTGQKFGSVAHWGPDRALVVDGLTGLGFCAMSLVIGNKPVRSQTDWGIAQDSVEGLVQQLCDGCKCHFILLSHIERETDQVQGGTKITVSTLGKALAPKLPPKFSDVILAVRIGSKFSWDTANSQTDLKSRNLPIKDGQDPSFSHIIDKWKSRGGRLSPTIK